MVHRRAEPATKVGQYWQMRRYICWVRAGRHCQEAPEPTMANGRGGHAGRNCTHCLMRGRRLESPQRTVRTRVLAVWTIDFGTAMGGRGGGSPRAILRPVPPRPRCLYSIVGHCHETSTASMIYSRRSKKPSGSLAPLATLRVSRHA